MAADAVAEDAVNSERMRYFHAKYISYSRAVSVMWAVLSICHLIITIVCFVQPSWLETTEDVTAPAHFGLWKYFLTDSDEGIMIEYGALLNFNSVPSSQFSTTGSLVGIAIILGCLTVLTLGLSFCLSSNIVFMACGWIMSLNAVIMGLACALFPTGWGSQTIAKVCQSSSYDPGLCNVGNSFLLAGISGCDSVVMAILAFILAYRQVTLLPWAQDEDDAASSDPKDAK